MLWIGASARQPAPAQGRPNIVFVLADDLGVNDLGVYGRKEHRTPSLDRLAAEGLRFTTAYVASPICSPSRAAIMTGRFPARLHLTTFIPGRPDAASQKLLHPPMRQQLPLEEKTLAEHLRGAGYATAMIGKWHLGEAGFSPREQGFDVFHAGQATTAPSDVEGGKGEYDLTREAERFIDANRDRPFFLYLAHNNPHIPFRSARPELIASNRSAFEPAYAATVQTLDDSVGRLLAHLDKTGLRDRTIVIFTSDNGGLHVPEGPHPRVTHNTPYRAGKGYLFEGGLRVPLIVRGPGLAARRVVDAPFVNVDWLPTLLELSGTDVPREIDGVSQASVANSVLAPAALHQSGQPAGGSRARRGVEARRALRRRSAPAVQPHQRHRRGSQSRLRRTRSNGGTPREAPVLAQGRRCPGKSAEPRCQRELVQRAVPDLRSHAVQSASRRRR
jgi:arylsulfatase A-like enzyme